MKRFLMSLVMCLVIILSGVTTIAYAKTDKDSNVGDTNDGNAGYIFVYNQEEGNESLGTWTNPNCIPSLKGAKGDKGDVGPQGPQGIAGQDGLNGTDGSNGVDGIAGQDGLNGIDGQNGDKGDTGEQGIQGDIGFTGADGAKGDTGDIGSKGDEGKKGDRGLQGERGKGLENRVEVIGEVRLFDSKKTTWSVYAGRDLNNDVNIVGAKVTLKIGRSYYEKKIDDLETKINNMNPSNTTETITKNEKGEIISIHISNNDKGINVTQRF